MKRLFVFLLIAILLGLSVGWSVYTDRLDRLSDRGKADLTFAADRVTSTLFRYRELAVFLARHPDMTTALTLQHGTPAAQDVVQAMADLTGASDVAVMDRNGRILAGSAGASLARDPTAQPLARALSGALGSQNEIVPTVREPRRVFSFAAPVQNTTGRVIGAVMTRMPISQIEDNWPGDARPVFFTDRQNRVFITNRSDLILSNRGDGFPLSRVRSVAGHELWNMAASRYLPSTAVHLTRDIPTIGLTAEILVDTSSATSAALLWALIAAGAFVTFGFVLTVVQQKRRALAERLEVEAAANARLEARVTERTHELTTLNADLIREVSERKEAEAALKRAQDDLVQAGKLSALGQMSAGISHELNQPLMAIRSFAENGEQFFDRGKPDVARDNLSKISELARRMGRIIQNLRAFARQESGPISNVDLVRVVEAALEMTEEKRNLHGATVSWSPPEGAVFVRGGEVRLQQVVVNLLSNAVDAMGESAEKRIFIDLSPGAPTTLSIRDTGPGIADPDRVFDPFYTTKEVGAAEGMGLGLSISYGLLQSFGGDIRGANHPDGGAVFTIELVSAAEREAA